MHGVINELIVLLPVSFVSILTAKFNELLTHEHRIPKEWSDGLVVLLFKGGVPTEPDKYRPITLLSAIFKLFEAVLLVRLQQWLPHKNFISPQQCGSSSRTAAATT